MSKRPLTSADNLPPEITEAILSRLPAKSLGRFKSVSKRWESLISDPGFIKTHLHHSHQTSEMIVFTDTKSLYSVNASQLFQCLNNDNIDIPVTGKEISNGSRGMWWKEMFGSCNGLVLAQDENDNLLLMNPTTRELVEIPPSPYEGDLFVSYGIGYDSSTDDYKVLSHSIWHPLREGESNIQLSVYSLRHNSWRKLPEYPYDDVSLRVVTNQNLNYYWSEPRSTIVAFSLANEEFSVINLPTIRYWSPEYLLDVGGKLGYVLDTREGYELWVMEETWTMVCYIALEKEIHVIKPQCLVKGSNRVIVLGDVGGEVFVYNMNERRSRNVRIAGGASGSAFVKGTYVESLESLERIISGVDEVGWCGRQPRAWSYNEWREWGGLGQVTFEGSVSEAPGSFIPDYQIEAEAEIIRELYGRYSSDEDESELEEAANDIFEENGDDEG